MDYSKFTQKYLDTILLAENAYIQFWLVHFYCFENEISLYYGALASFKGVTSEETEITNGRL